MLSELNIDEIIINTNDDLIFVGDNGEKLDLFNNQAWTDNKSDDTHYTQTNLSNSNITFIIDDNLLLI